jgi:transposase
MAQILVALLGASSFHLRQGDLDWIDAHVRAFGAFTVFLNSSHWTTPRPPSSRPASTTLRSIAPYAEMAAHYGTGILPTRPRKPRDKAKVEQAVLIVERWLLGRLR